ncbi:MAG: GH36-type glycosyl hydrolase domain-containing protein, partial [Acetanaerobacterium sp.]
RRTRPFETDASVAVGFLDETQFEYETVKSKILVRPGGIASLAGAFDKPFTGGDGVPDAACAIRTELELAPGAQQELAFVIAVDDTAEGAISRVVAARRRGIVGAARAARSPVATTRLEDRIGQSVLPQLFYPRRENAEGIAAAQHNEMGLHGLWGLSISGDYPIVLFEARQPEDVVLCEGYIKLMQKLRLCNVLFDLVVAYSHPSQGEDTVREALAQVAHNCMAEDFLDARIGIHPVNLARHDARVRTLLFAAASHVVEQSLVRTPKPAGRYVPLHPVPVQKEELHIIGEDRIIGGVFTKERFYSTGTPDVPWCHILSNPAFGTLLSDKALGFSWAVNSRENKLTPWYNDLSLDNVGEMLLADIGGVRYDLVDGALASFSPRDAVYEGRAGGIKTRVVVSVSPGGCAKYLDVAFENTQKEEIAIELSYYTEPVLGVNRTTARHLIPRRHGGMLMLTNPFNTAVGGCMAVGCDKQELHLHCDRAAFLCGEPAPEQLAPNDDPCAAVIHPFKLPPSGRYTARFILSYGANPDACLQQIYKTPQQRAEENSIWIDTPDKTLNHLINTWLPHQTAHARMMGRTGYYQCGGAWGFRDQLQDVCACLLISPRMARRHIVRAAGVQFKEGDVLHWWHSLPESGGGIRGVRTRYSDDLLWLPYTVCEYLEKTGDDELLGVRIPYLGGAELAIGEHERYFGPSRSDETGDIYDHCCRAIDHAMRLGGHGLPLMGSGDWNDGFNLVGADGRGESVWLALFLTLVLERFAPVCERRGDTARAKRCHNNAALLRQAVDDHCYDGGWYLRAFYDDGMKMGSAANDECRIDSLPQSFAVFADMPDKERVHRALENAYSQLVDRENGIVKLFTPAFSKGMQNPGYVKAYPAGLRENGGQYTHAAVWFAQALLKAGMTEKGYEILCMLNPANKYKNERTAQAYKLEPYYIAADVYTNPSAYGRGGWSIYTGAAGWYYRAVVEDLLGVRLRGQYVELAPGMPKEWDGFSMRLVFSGTTIRVSVSAQAQDAPAAVRVALDGGVHDISLACKGVCATGKGAPFVGKGPNDKK